MVIDAYTTMSMDRSYYVIIKQYLGTYQMYTKLKKKTISWESEQIG